MSDAHGAAWTGRRLRDARGRMRRSDGRPWTQEDLADQIGASPRSVAAWERTEAVPQAHFGVKLDDLFNGQPVAEDVDVANPRIKQATAFQLFAELQCRYSEMEARQTRSNVEGL